MKLTKIASKLFSSFFSWMPQSTPWKENLENYIICIDLLLKCNLTHYVGTLVHKLKVWCWKRTKPRRTKQNSSTVDTSCHSFWSDYTKKSNY